MPFRFSTEPQSDRIVLRLFGDCDLSSLQDLQQAILSALAESPAVQIDLSAVGFLDSSGIHAMVLGYRHAEQHGRALYVTGAGGMVSHVLKMTGVADLLAPPSPGNGHER
ncbi:STAS domain-containing protein [Catellatospora sichuanensis]|uniref:STAS domain-containing protein n=1 Tax=Catellatospora sichuanensis TaxID=1969805 RepID=UPI0016423D15|nr:STAS domain-containing protein [Catellatospora sichuanensis]